MAAEDKGASQAPAPMPKAAAREPVAAPAPAAPSYRVLVGRIGGFEDAVKGSVLEGLPADEAAHLLAQGAIELLKA